jgi:D-alanyl-D-alanine carboxypeptidase
MLRRQFKSTLFGMAGGLVCAGAVLIGCTDDTSVFDSFYVIQTELQTALDRTLADTGLPGAVLLARSPQGQVWKLAGGTAHDPLVTPSSSEAGNRESGWQGRALTTKDHFRIGSVTKSLTATLILILTEEEPGLLDQTLDDYYPAFPYSDRITVRMMLNHTSGLYDYTSDENYQHLLDDEPWHEFEPEDLLKYALGYAPYFVPGQGWKYSNTNYILLGLIAEAQVPGKTYEEILEEKILIPLGLTHTIAPTGIDLPESYAHGYYYFVDHGWKDVTETKPSLAWAAGGLISTIDDMDIWLGALISGSLLPEWLREEQFTFVDTGEEGLRYGLGVWDIKGRIGHRGAVPGYTSYVWRYRAYDFCGLFNGVGEEGPDLQVKFLDACVEVIFGLEKNT